MLPANTVTGYSTEACQHLARATTIPSSADPELLATVCTHETMDWEMLEAFLHATPTFMVAQPDHPVWQRVYCQPMPDEATESERMSTVAHVPKRLRRLHLETFCEFAKQLFEHVSPEDAGDWADILVHLDQYGETIVRTSTCVP